MFRQKEGQKKASVPVDADAGFTAFKIFVTLAALRPFFPFSIS